MSFRTLVVWTVVLAGCSSVVEQTDISYDGRFANDVLDIYSPPPASTPRPAVLVIHGGGWTEGVSRSSMAAHAERLADAGYVTINIEYRLVPNGGQFPNDVQDCYCALAYVRGHAIELGIDPIGSPASVTPPAVTWSRCSAPIAMPSYSPTARRA